MEISTETRNAAMILTQSKKILDEKIYKFSNAVYNMYAYFLRENKLNGDVIYDGKVVGRLKIVYSSKAALYANCHLIRFYPKKSPKSHAWNVTDIGDYDFEKNCQHILKYFKPYGEERRRERVREYEMETSTPKKRERER